MVKGDAESGLAQAQQIRDKYKAWAEDQRRQMEPRNWKNAAPMEWLIFLLAVAFLVFQVAELFLHLIGWGFTRF